MRRTRKPSKGKQSGRNRKPIDWQVVERLSRRGYTPDEVAEALCVTVPTLEQYDCFRPIYKKANALWKINLRRRLYQKAMSGDIEALTLLGKTRLGQTEPPEGARS